MRRIVGSLACLWVVACVPLTGDTGGDDICPDANDPCVHYESPDPDECTTLDFVCDTDQSGFTGSCGCGCLDACR